MPVGMTKEPTMTTADGKAQESLEETLRKPMSRLDLAGTLLDISGTNADTLDQLVSVAGWGRACDVLIDAFQEQDLPMMASVHGARCLRPTWQGRRNPSDRRKVAIYYLSLGTGGGERITMDIALSWRDMGYDVLLLCDENRLNGVHDLGPNITIRGLPDCRDTDPEVRIKRAHALHDALCEHEAEILVYSHWLGASMGRDMLATQLAGTKFYLFNHGTSRCTSGYKVPSYLRLPGLLRYADGIVCLSEEDRAFFSSFNDCVMVVPNRVDQAFFEQPAPTLNGNRMVWVGRISWDKSPVEMLDALVAVRQQVPDATLSFIGPFRSYSSEQMHEEVERRGLSDAVDFLGDIRHEDLPMLLPQYDLAVFTSHLEGYLVSLAEAKAIGLPVVMYDMDYLTLLDGHRGVRVAPLGEVQALADRCVEVLRDKGQARRLGKEGRSHAEELHMFDMGAVWEELFSGNGRAQSKIGNDATVASALWEASCEEARMRRDIDRLTEERNALEERCHKAEQDLEAVTGSKSFRWGRMLTFPLRKARDMAHRLRPVR